MSTLTANDFTSGYTPSDDAIRGRRNGLLRMENVTLDSYGYKEQAGGPGQSGSTALTLTRGTVKVNTTQFLGSVHSIFSRILNGVLCRYVGLSDGTVLRDENSLGTFPDQLVADGGPASTIGDAFGAAFNYVLIVAGATRVKDDGTNLYNLGVTSPDAPVTAVPESPATVDISSSWVVTATDGTVTSSATDHFVADAVDTGLGVKFTGYFTESSSRDLMDFGSGDIGTPNDTLGIHFRCPDSDAFQQLKVTFYFNTVDGSPSSAPDFTDYYEITWDQVNGLLGVNPPYPPGPVIRAGIDQWNVLECKRSDFYRVGSDSTKDWTNVLGVRYAILYNAPATNMCVAESWFSGSTAGPLTGNYDYIQVNVGNHGYFAQSAAGPPLVNLLSLLNTSATITPQTPVDPQVNEVWIFRRNSGVAASDPLANFLRVAQITSDLDSPFTDSVSDSEAQVIDVKLNQFLMSVQDTRFPNDVYYIVTNYFERTLYMCPRSILISDNLDPDAVDLSFTVQLSGDSSEYNLWMIKAGPSTLLVGTTLDIYELDGTLVKLPDGTFDLNIRPLGIKQPPVQTCVSLYKNTLFYIGTDGLNTLTGVVNTSFNGALDLLWAGNTRFGQLPFYKSPANDSNFHMAVSKGKLFIQTTLTDTSRNTFVYDFKRGYWYVYLLSTYALFVEEDDTLLAGFADADDFYLRIIDVGDTFDYNDTGQTVRLLFPSLDNNQPFNRKDSFTLKLMIDTGGQDFTVNIYPDESTSPIGVAAINCVGLTEISVDISATVGICKRYQLELLCAGGTNSFALTEYAIEYEARPTQTLYLRIPPSNFGIAGRKRIPAIPLLIDTLGSDVTFTPVLDNVDQATSTINTADKEVFNHFFTADEKAYVFGGKLEGENYFEFYESIQPRIIELLPDPARFFYMPTDTLGTQCRKRIIAIAFIIDTQGNNVTYTPIIDGSSQTPATVNTTGKRTFIYFFTTNVEGIDIAGTLSGSSFFEYYGLELNECLSEKMPVATKILVIPQSDLGTPDRKRFSSYKFVINTRGSDVTFTPRIDSTNYSTITFSNTEKTTVEYFFDDDTIGIDAGGRLTSSTGPFEFYGPLQNQDIEKLPPRLTFFVIPENNFGAPAQKRVRTLPMIINTNGNDVTFTPIVDGTPDTPTVFNTPSKRTVFHYFQDDTFGIDYKGTLDGGVNPFEFYGMMTPVDVEVIPVGKMWDQLGPIEFPRLGKLLIFRLRVIANADIDYIIYADDVSIYSATIACLVGVDKVYEVKFPKGITCTTFRVVLTSSAPFNRYYGRFKVNKSGMDTESTWQMFGADPDAKPK